MLSSPSYLSLLTLTALLSSRVQSQISFPQCIRDCIDASPDTTCSTSDIACLCRASRSQLLPNIVTCMHNNCVTIDPTILLSPLQFACQIAGATLPQSVIDAAESRARELETAQPTATVTNEFTRISSVSVEITTTVAGKGSTQTLIYPITIERTQTVSGEPSTVTKEGTSQTVLVPVVLTTTDSAGSTITTTVSRAGAVNTVTTTDSRGSTVTERTTLISTTTAAGGGGSSAQDQNSSGESDGTTTLLESTTVAGVPFTSTNPAGSSPTQNNGRPASETNSAPFLDTNAGAELSAKSVWSWAGLVFLGAAGVAMWL